MNGVNHKWYLKFPEVSSVYSNVLTSNSMKEGLPWENSSCSASLEIPRLLDKGRLLRCLQ